MGSEREEKILKNARSLRQREHRLSASLRLHTIREAEEFVKSRGLVSVLGGNELPSIISAFLGREWKPSGNGFAGWLDWWSLKISGQNLGRELSKLDRAGDIVPLRVFRKSKTLVSRELWPILTPIVKHYSDLAATREMFSKQEWEILKFIQNSGPVRTDKLRNKIDLQGKANTASFHTSLATLESYGLIIGTEDPAPERHLHANIWRSWNSKVRLRTTRREYAYQDSIEQLLFKTMDAAILAHEREVGKWFQWRQPTIEAKERLLDSGRSIQAEDFLVTPRVLNL